MAAANGHLSSYPSHHTPSTMRLREWGRSLAGAADTWVLSQLALLCALLSALRAAAGGGEEAQELLARAQTIRDARDLTP
eukprot:910875-Rhodomonas_salina.1